MQSKTPQTVSHCESFQQNLYHQMAKGFMEGYSYSRERKFILN